MLLTIGTAVYNDFDSLWFTVESLMDQDLTDCEILVVDNKPDSIEGKASKEFVEGIGHRYIAFPTPKGSCPPRGEIFRQAKGDFCLVIDSHVLLVKDSFERLKKYLRENQKTDNLIHGVLLTSNRKAIQGTHMIPGWRSQMYGHWGVDDRGKDVNGEPFEIPMHGLGLFVARTKSWLGFHPDLIGFSGGEGAIHTKYHKAGRKVLCHPGVRWVHKFQRPRGVPHQPLLGEKLRNILLAWNEVGMDLQEVVDHFVGGVGTRNNQGVVSTQVMQDMMRKLGINMSVKAKTSKSGLIIGTPTLGAFKMRGEPLVKALKWQTFNPRGVINIKEQVDVILAVKTPPDERLRKATRRLIWDALDAFYVTSEDAHMNPNRYWVVKYKSNPFDELIVTSPAAASTTHFLPSDIRIHMIPHYADPRVKPNWYNPNGPIVYTGQSTFIVDAKQTIEAAAAKLGKTVKWDHSADSWKSLEGASLSICARLGNMSTYLNRYCKPAVKVANAAAAGVPVLATDDPAVTSLWTNVVTCSPNVFMDVKLLANYMADALQSKPLVEQFTFADWQARMVKLLNE